MSVAGLRGEGARHHVQVEDEERRGLGQRQQELNIGGVPLGVNPASYEAAPASEAFCGGGGVLKRADMGVVKGADRGGGVKGKQIWGRKERGMRKDTWIVCGMCLGREWWRGIMLRKEAGDYKRNQENGS